MAEPALRSALRFFSAFGVAAAVVAAATLIRLIVLTDLATPLSMDEAQYWIWSRDPAFGYFSKPPFLAWLIAGVTSLCGDGASCVRAASPLLHGITALVVYGIGHRLMDARAGAWCAVTYILLPGVSFSSLVASTDVPLLLFWALAFYALVRLRAETRWRWWILLGVALGFGALSKYAMLFFVLGGVVWALMDDEARKLFVSYRAVAALTLAGLIALPNVLWNADHAFVSYRHVVSNMAVTADLFHPGKAAEFVAAQLGVFGPILFVVLLAALWRAPKSLMPQYKMLAAFTFPIIIVITGQALLSRAHANWAATAYVAGTVLAVAACVAWNKTNFLKASLALHLVTAGVLYNYEALAQSLGITLTRKIDPAVRVRGWDAAGTWSSALQQAHPQATFLFDDRNTMTELIYYTRPHPLTARLWNPSGEIGHHFAMTAALTVPTGGSFIYVTRLGGAAGVLPFFDAAEPLGGWRAVAYPGNELSLNAFLLTGFRGYSSASPVLQEQALPP